MTRRIVPDAGALHAACCLEAVFGEQIPDETRSPDGDGPMAVGRGSSRLRGAGSEPADSRLLVRLRGLIAQWRERRAQWPSPDSGICADELTAVLDQGRPVTPRIPFPPA